MIVTTVEKDGFEGILFGGDRTKQKVVIVMSGSNGGMSLTEKEAQFYHQHGIPALALALFKTKQTQKDLDRVPVEYVERAIAWLKKCGYQRIAIDGTSKGSELALLAGSMFPRNNVRDRSCAFLLCKRGTVHERLIKRTVRHLVLELSWKRAAVCIVQSTKIQHG